MRRGWKVLLGVATLWPLAYGLMFHWLMARKMARAGGVPPDFIDAPLVATVVLMYALVAFYLVTMFLGRSVPKSKRPFWALLLVGCNMFAIPVYWYLYVWRVPKEPKDDSQADLKV